MQKSLFILHLSSLLLFNFNYSSEEVTKSAAKQIAVSIGTSIITVAAWSNKEMIRDGLWALTELANQWSHNKTQKKVEKTHDLLETKIYPEMTAGFTGLKGLLEKTKEDTGIIRPHIENMKTKIENINTNTQEIKTTINANNLSTNSKIDALLNNAEKNVKDYFDPIKTATLASLELNKTIDQRTNAMDTKLNQILEKLNQK